MTNPMLPIKRAAVLGAGVMGAQIAAHMASAGIPVYLYDLASDQGKKNEIAEQGRQRLTKLKPPPLAAKSVLDGIQAMSFDGDLEKLTHCDLIIEAVAERMEIKRDLYTKIVPHLSEHTIFASNTSGLSITELASTLPEKSQSRFCGIHFFNPPRYMHLVELIPQSKTDESLLDQLEDFLTRRLGKGVVRAKDTPNFIANRVGVFTMWSTMYHAERLGLGFDTVDALTGPAIGRPKSATFRLADVVGLDTMGNVIRTMHDKLPSDPWHAFYQAPTWLSQLLDNGALGQKTGAGVFKKEGRDILVFDPSIGDYRATDYALPETILAILAIKDPKERLVELAKAETREAEFLWSIHRDLFHYCAYHLEDIANSAREVDQAMCWGYGWKLGPFEQWQQAGWKSVSELIGHDIDAGKTGVTAPMPAWVSQIDGVHSVDGSYSPSKNNSSSRSHLAVYDRQYQAPRLLGESFEKGHTIEETEFVRLFTLKNDVLIVSLKTNMGVIEQGVVDGLHRALDLAQSNHQGLIIWQPRGPFSAGANLKAATNMIERGDWDSVSSLVTNFQAVNLRMRYCEVPTVAAVRGLALGGGLELAMHTSKRVAHLESYMGLVEAGVGLLPGGGGLATLALQAQQDTHTADSYPLLEKRYKQVAMGQVSGSAMEAREMGYLRPQDVIVMHEHELLHAAHYAVYALHAEGYRPELPEQPILAAGDVGIATMKMLLVNMLAGQFISEHDFEIGERIATVMCGGAIDRGTPVTETWLHRLEREHFLALAAMPKTQERIGHMLKTGKPLRN